MTERTPLNPISEGPQILETLHGVKKDVEILHPLLDLLKDEDGTLSNYADRILEILATLDERLIEVSEMIAADRRDRNRHNERIEKLLKLLEAPGP